MKFTRLGDLLIDAGVITQEQLGQALANQKKTKRRLGDELVQSGIITERQVVDALTMQLGIDFIDLTTVDIAPEMTKLVPKNLAKRYSVVPVRTRGDELYLAMSDPLNFIATEEVRAASRRRVVPMIAMQSGIDHAISKLYGTEGAKRAIMEMQQEVGDAARERSSLQVAEVGEQNESSAPSIRLVDNIIERGLSSRASDIHIEPMEKEVIVRMRIDGLLHTEFNIEGVNQVQINEKTGTTFASGLRSILRQDPDIISIGEIRDQETADIAFRSAVTGHYVLSTLHTNDAVSTLDRLDDIGVESFMVSTALKGVISQRLVRRVCPHCKEMYTPSEEELLTIGIDPVKARAEGLMLARGRGCAECYQSGYLGRIVVVETLVIDKGIRHAIASHASRAELNAAVARSGFEPVIVNCRELVRQGITTIEEVQRVVFSDED